MAVDPVAWEDEVVGMPLVRGRSAGHVWRESAEGGGRHEVGEAWQLWEEGG